MKNVRSEVRPVRPDDGPQLLDNADSCEVVGVAERLEHRPDRSGEALGEIDVAEGDSGAVGFLDLSDLDHDRVIAAIIDGSSRLDDDAVLTAFCTTADAHVMSELCQRHGMVLVHAVTHDSGTTFVLQRSSR